MKIIFKRCSRPKTETIISIAFCFLFVIACAAGAEQNVEKVLTLEDSIDLAIANSQQLISEQLDIKIAGQRLKEAKSGMYPQLEFNANYSKFYAESPLFISPILGSTILPSRKSDLPDAENYYTAKVSLYQVLWSAGKLNATKKYADTELKTAQGNYETIKNRTVANVKKSFFRLLAIQRKLDICNAAIKDIKAIDTGNGDLRNRLKSKKIAREIEESAKQTQEELETERIDFLEAIGAELDTTFTVVGDFEFTKKNIDLNKCLAWAGEYRPELINLVLQEQMDALEVSLSLSGRYPTIAIGGNYQLEDTNLQFEQKSWNATINLNLPVFDGFALASRITQKKYQYRKSQIYRASVMDSINAEVRKIYLDYDYAVSQLELKKSDYETLPDTGTGALKGMSECDALEVEKIVMETKLEYIDAVKNAIVTQIELENAVGKSID